jgi:hypothetical protein
MKLGQSYTPGEFGTTPTPIPSNTSEPLLIEITGGREQTWFEANKGWVLPVGFVALFMLANR